MGAVAGITGGYRLRALSALGRAITDKSQLPRSRRVSSLRK
jgi:hypothetical protein